MRYKIGQAWSPNDPRPHDMMSWPVRAGQNALSHVSARNDGPTYRTEDDDGDRKRQNLPDALASVRGRE